MEKLKLTYFDFSGSRGEECRLALFVAGVDFEDNRLAPGEWQRFKTRTPYGGLPTLESAGKPTLSQSNAILAYVGRLHGLHPQEPWAAACHEAILQAVEDLRAAMSPLTEVKGEPAKRKTRREFINGYLTIWARNLEAQIEGPFVAGNELNVADIKLFVMCHSLSSGVYEYFPEDILDNFPKLKRLHEAAGKHEKIAEWRARHSS